MSASPPPLPGRRRDRIGGWWYLLGSGLVVVIVGIVLLVHWRLGFHRDVIRRSAQIAAEGLPRDCAELDRWYAAVPDAENAAEVYSLAFDLMEAQVEPGHEQSWMGLELPRRLGKLSADQRAQVETAVVQNAEALEAAYRAAGMTACRYPIDLTEGPKAPLPHLRQLKTLATLLEFDALLRAEAGQPAKAAEAVRASFALSRSLEGEPTLISQLAAASIEERSCRSLERVLSYGAVPEADLVALWEHIVALELTNRFVTGLIGERAMYSDVIRLAQTDPGKLAETYRSDDGNDDTAPRRTRQPGLLWQALGFFERDHAFYLSVMETNINLVRLGPPRSLAAPDLVWARIDGAARRLYIFSSLLLPPTVRIATRDAEHRALLRAAGTALSIEIWRRTHENQVPKSLAELVPRFLGTVPKDPFDGGPVRFKRMETGYVVYSIGRDRQDDGGRETPPRKTKVPPEERGHNDITFTVQR